MVDTRHVARDGTAKYLFRLVDGATVEAVDIPDGGVVVYLIPPPARSLRSLPGGTSVTQAHTSRDHTRAEDDSPGSTATTRPTKGTAPGNGRELIGLEICRR